MFTFDVGQQVNAGFYGWSKSRYGVVSGPVSFGSVPVQFEPAGAHYMCAVERVWPFGNRGGWSEREYRIARESAKSREHAHAIENERNEKYPGAPFSPSFQ